MPPTSMHLNVHAREDAYIFGPATRHLHGAARMREEVAGSSFLMSPAAFSRPTFARRRFLCGSCSTPSGRPHASSTCAPAAACLRCRSPPLDTTSLRSKKTASPSPTGRPR